MSGINPYNRNHSDEPYEAHPTNPQGRDARSADPRPGGEERGKSDPYTFDVPRGPGSAGSTPMIRNLPMIDVGDIRLQRLLVTGAQLASLTEYARHAEMDVLDILAQIEPYLDANFLELESVQHELFLHTAPKGRPLPEGSPFLPANLWELLRQVGDQDYAAMLWRIVRGLESGGWTVRTHPTGAVSPLTFLELHADGTWLPMIVLPRRGRLSAADGPLSRAEGRRVQKVVVVCGPGHLDDAVTEIRTWMTLAKRKLTVLLLEQPRYTPCVLASTDTSVRPTSISRTVPKDAV